MRMVLEEEIKLHRFAGISPEQSFAHAARHRQAMVAPEQNMIIRCYGDDLAGFINDDFHAAPPMQRASVSACDDTQKVNLMSVSAFQP
ncbi:hypothetical protein XH79_08395 [Bradyrhizobium sp. CCBAU 45389]|nr:hypothetical protein [Bradyrhizobium sp. CCBAU 45389]